MVGQFRGVIDLIELESAPHPTNATTAHIKRSCFMFE
jgi:hypothetical protein